MLRRAQSLHFPTNHSVLRKRKLSFETTQRFIETLMRRSSSTSQVWCICIFFSNQTWSKLVFYFFFFQIGVNFPIGEILCIWVFQIVASVHKSGHIIYLHLFKSASKTQVICFAFFQIRRQQVCFLFFESASKSLAKLDCIFFFNSALISQSICICIFSNLCQQHR